ncbi:class I SAM-dependent methyltransferase, partial [Dehalococcoidia bacterium]|nr:class I SAM-dependent methyltransferase [Dehalococcoidia bacterium]
ILCAATVAARPKTLLHVGGFWGRTSIASILALMSVQNGGEPSDYRIDIVEIDPEWHKIIEKNITSFGLENVAHVHYGSSLDVIPRLLDHCEGYDFAFLDGDHRFETVTKELRLLTDRVKVLAFDDLNQSSGPGQVFEELVVLHPTIIFNSHKVDRHDMRMYLRTTSKAWQEKVLHENQDRMVMQNGVGSRMGIALMDTDIG